MPTYDIIPFLNGMSVALYIVIYLMCGLQLCFNIFQSRNNSHTLLSRWVGTILLCLSVTISLYLISIIIPGCERLVYVGTIVDFILISLLGCCAYILYANRRPPIKVMIVSISPYAVIILLVYLFDALQPFAYDAVMLLLISQYLFYFRRLYRLEKKLYDLYSNPDAHSLSWLCWAAVFYFLWWAGHAVCVHADLLDYYNSVVLTNSAVLIFYVTLKINNHAEPVSLETLEQMEIPSSEENNTVQNTKSLSIQKALVQLYEEQQVYLNPDLTIDDVAFSLRVNSKYLSTVLNKDMNISFYQFTNEYRILKAK